MILAAGFGTRLKPYSLFRPKPLFPVLDQPLLQVTLEKLRQSGFGPIIINAHYQRHQFVELIRDEPDVILQLEEEIMGTGGGMRLAMPAMGRQPVLVINGDIYHDIDLSEVYDAHLRSGALATLVLHDYPRFNSVTIKGERIASFSLQDGKQQLAFTGIHVLDPALLSQIPPDEFYNIIDCYRYWIDKGAFIRAHVVKNQWTDIGTPDDYLILHGLLLGEEKKQGRSPCYLGEDVSMADDVQLRDWVCIGSRVRIGRGAKLTRVVVWDGASIADAAVLKDEIIVS